MKQDGKFMIRKGMMLFFICVLSTPSFGEVYRPSKELSHELKQHAAIFKKNPRSNDARFNYAMSCAYTGRIKEGWDTLKLIPEPYAEGVVKKNLELFKKNPENWRYPFKLAFGYYFINNKKDAITSFDDVLKIDPENIWAMGFKALILGEKGEVDACIDLCKQAIAIEPNAPAIHFLLAEGYRRKKEYLLFMSEMMIMGRLQTEEALLGDD